MKSEILEVPGCSQTTIRKLFEEEGLQILEVEVQPGGEIPLHTHDCAATMVILDGKARALGNHERQVNRGDVVVKQPHEPHGFDGIDGPFSFVSISNENGIVRSNGWDLKYL